MCMPMKNQVKDDQAFKNMREILTLCLFTCALDIQREGLLALAASQLHFKATQQLSFTATERITLFKLSKISGCWGKGTHLHCLW